jgi:hypothetical protein
LSLQGLDFPDVEVEQGIQKMARAWIQGDTGSEFGDLLQTALEQAQLEVGISIPLLEADYALFDCLLPRTWVKGLWDFIWKHRLAIGNHLQCLPPLQWTGNEFIMERVAYTHHFSDAQIMSINCC